MCTILYPSAGDRLLSTLSGFRPGGWGGGVCVFQLHLADSQLYRNGVIHSGKGLSYFLRDGGWPGGWWGWGGRCCN